MTQNAAHQNVTSSEIQETPDFLYDEQDPPPSYAEAVLDDGRVEIDLDSRLCRSLSLLVPRIQQAATAASASETPPYTETSRPIVKLNIVIQVVGSRGDVQPFIALGQELQKYGHRVRLATHDCFSDFVRQSSLEFFSIGGDPTELMAYMVKNPGLMPSMKSLRAGDVQAKRKMVAEMLVGCWRSCIEPDPQSSRPFVADAIIGNPPSFAHIHCAQALRIPVHLMFTMPWTVTKAFSHPLANIVNKGKLGQGQETANFVSHIAVEWITWQGLGDIVNNWRRSTLGLEPVPFSEGPLLAENLKIPCTYCWSPALVPKPADWGQHIVEDVCGFFFREPSPYTPPKQLDNFLLSGTPPIYIGFGSIVIDDPDRLTQILLEAVRKVGVRAIISKGWSKLGQNIDSDPNVFFLGDCPHEWLFQKVSAVIHHGGAGTTACGLLSGRPTAVVPFFGDQQFWGDMVAEAGAGPKPIPQRTLDSDNLAEAIRVCLTDSARTAARGISERMKSESGVRRAVASFHANLPSQDMACDVLADQPATWVMKKKPRAKLSKTAAGILVRQSKLRWADLKPCDTKVTEIELRRWDPVTAVTSSVMGLGIQLAGSATDIAWKPYQAFSRPSEPKSGRSSSIVQEGSSADGDSVHSASRSDLQPATSKSRSMPDARTFGNAAIGAASGVGGLVKHSTKAVFQDVPLAVAEGMRNAPRLYGGEVYEPGVVRDWKSGGIVAAKNFGHGLFEGIGGLVTTPIKEGKKHGAAGAALGVGKGVLNLVTKTSSGSFGLLAFTTQGIYKSMHTAIHSTTRKAVREARIMESEYEAHFMATESELNSVNRNLTVLFGSSNP
ncbi:hypothetical protein NLU13_7837 [Sarocladium strictum]|uniref:Glycosyltransferase family 28 N-terminal domain-containing protein n=1 Tax=Sarocladium strictum TaxID=5046 RepID=A0AA39GE43_SARSR|nr:hypothetical protein NLU13_7837 [Sarocladium strictum]